MVADIEANGSTPEEAGGVTAGSAGVAREHLVRLWRRAHGRPPPAGISRRLLELDAAWHRQAAEQGGIGPALARRLDRLIGGRAAPPPQTPPVAGTRYVRVWHGRTHVVDVTPAGFRYDGHIYASLSAVARAITGARWSGPRFFRAARRDDGG